MKTEFEAKFVEVDIDEIRERLTEVGATLVVPMRLMRRVTIDTPTMKAKDAFLRVRDEGHRVTMTYKQFDSLSVDGAKEHEVIVSDFSETVQLLQAAGLPYQSFQESKRESWVLEDSEIVIDEWPWLRPYIEIESTSEARVQEVAALLGFSWEEAVFGDVMAAYRKQYPHLTEKDTVGNLDKVTFDEPLPSLLMPRI